MKISPWIKYPAIAVALIFGGLLVLTVVVFKNDPKAFLMEAMILLQNEQSQNFHGKIVDQNGQPVIDAKAIGTLMKIRGFDIGEKREVYTTQSDRNGNFEFRGFRGWQLGVIVQKDGYQLGQGAGAYQAPNAQVKSNSSERAIFHMWKLQGPEPMTHFSINARIPVDGTPWACNLEEGHHDINGNNDLNVQLTRSPQDILPMQNFAWSATVSIPTGGFIACKDLYLNLAPLDGYEPSITINMPANATNWSRNFDGKYYFKSQNGKSYGLITIGIGAGYQPPPTAFDIGVYLNPSGSRNLEFDSSKQINP